MAQLVVLAVGGIERKDDALEISDGGGFNVGERQVLYVEGSQNALEHKQLIGATCFVGDTVRLQVDAPLKKADQNHGDNDDQGSDGCGSVEFRTAGHSDGGDDPDAGSAGESAETAAVVEDEPRTEEADALNDVRGDLALVSAVAGDDPGEDGEEGCAKADEEVGADARGLFGEFALESYEGAKDACQDEAADGAVDEAHLVEPAEGSGFNEMGELGGGGGQEEFLGRC